MSKVRAMRCVAIYWCMFLKQTINYINPNNRLKTQWNQSVTFYDLKRLLPLVIAQNTGIITSRVIPINCLHCGLPHNWLWNISLPRYVIWTMAGVPQAVKMMKYWFASDANRNPRRKMEPWEKKRNIMWIKCNLNSLLEWFDCLNV